jgi:hypothetical protein
MKKPTPPVTGRAAAVPTQNGTDLNNPAAELPQDQAAAELPLAIAYLVALGVAIGSACGGALGLVARHWPGS